MRIRKSIAVAFFALFFSVDGICQVGNEWINFSQQYYEFEVWQDGIYRIDHGTMAAAGVPVGSIAPSDFQVFGKERELFIYVMDGGDGTFDAGDYIEFFAEENSAWLDSNLFDNPSNLGNPHYSFYNDTLRYFLTWDASVNHRRMATETDVNFGAYTPLNWFWKESYVQYKGQYAHGYKEAGLSKSFYTEAEGWYSSIRNASNSNNYFNFDVPTPNTYTGAGAPNALIRTTSVGSSNSSPGNPNHHLQIRLRYNSAFATMMDTIFSGYKLIKGYLDVSPDSLSSTTRIQYKLVNDLGVSADNQQSGVTTIIYPHQINADNSSYFDFKVPFNSTESKSLFNFSNFSGSSPLVYILNDSMRRVSVVNNGTWDMLIPNSTSGQDQHVLIVDDTQIQSISSLDAINGTGYFTDYASMNVDSAYIIISHDKIMPSAQQYAAYRSSIQGGSHNVALINVYELYLQYGGGVNKHALGIRRFLDDLLNTWPSQPRFLFLLGKSVREATETTNGTSHGARRSQGAFDKNLVPSFGYPSSDILLSAGLDGNEYSPAIPTGRLATGDTSEVLEYLDKVMAMESAINNPTYTPSSKEWMKKALQFSGGSNAQEQNVFQFYLNNYEAIFEDTLYGGDAELFAKTSSAPIDPVDFADVQDRIEKGVALMTFFGHASVGGFDQNLDDPENWNNQGKYPFVIGNACYTGDIHQPDAISASELFVLVPDAGAIAFLSNVKTGFANYLDQYTTELYNQFCRDSYGKAMSYCIKETISQIEQNNPPFLLGTTLNQMTLHGDPAIKLYPHAHPEFHLEPSSVYFEPSDIDLTVDSVDINVVVTNLGRATTKQIILEIERILPNNNGDTLYSVQIDGSNYRDTITIRIPVLHNLAVGQNIFNVRVDIPSFVTESYDETSNNQVSKNLYINLDGIVPIYPYDFAIVPNDTITLKGSTVNPFASSKDYRFQIDTIDFEGAPSPFFREQTVTSSGGVVEARPPDWKFSNGNPAPLSFTDSTVYFWRVSLDTSSPQWLERSFQYINGRRGWGQAHFFQFKDDEFNIVEYDRPAREFHFGDLSKVVELQNIDNATNGPQYNFSSWYLDGGIQEYGTCWFTPMIQVFVIDPFTLDGWEDCDGNPNHCFGGHNCRSRPDKIFAFNQTSPSQMQDLDSMLNFIPNGYYVGVYSTFKTSHADMTANHAGIYTTFQNLGSTVDSTDSDRCFAFFTRVGNPAQTVEEFAQFAGDTIFLSDTIEASTYSGTVTTQEIGPASSWGSIHWQQHPLEAGGFDEAHILLYGLKPDGTESLLIDTIMTANDSIIDLELNHNADAAVYPLLRLQMETKDSVTFTPTQIDRWQVVYDPVPEAALNPKKGYYYTAQSDTISEGESIRLAVAIENVTDIAMDSLLIHYYIEDQYHQYKSVGHVRRDSLRAHEFTIDTIIANTAFFPGYNSFWMDMNPYNDTTGLQDQPEQYHFNNVAHWEFFADQDRINPILDVTFDGLHIMDGEVVSPKPLIVMKLDDENPFMLLNEDSDTANFQVWLTNPNGQQERVYFMNGSGERIMDWYPATGADNEFTIEYQGDFKMNGVYELLVQANDKSGNESGDFDYQITFEVIMESTITEVINYPNPFSTRTQFVFTLTGSELPTSMKIQIMTISGRVVREIMLDELGPLRIGRNMTSYWWDGTDEFGDRLANGVYLYKVTAKINGENIDYRSTSASTYFHKGFGKMYLMR